MPGNLLAGAGTHAPSPRCVTGEHEARVPIDSEMWMLDPTASPEALSWTTVSTLGNKPPPRIAHAQAVIGSTIYVFGGRQGIQMEESPLNDLHSYDTKSRTWSQVETKAGSPPTARSFHRLVFASCQSAQKTTVVFRASVLLQVLPAGSFVVVLTPAVAGWYPMRTPCLSLAGVVKTDV